MVSDNAPNFTSRYRNSFLKACGIMSSQIGCCLPRSNYITQWIQAMNDEEGDLKYLNWKWPFETVLILLAKQHTNWCLEDKLEQNRVLWRLVKKIYCSSDFSKKFKEHYGTQSWWTGPESYDQATKWKFGIVVNRDGF